MNSSGQPIRRIASNLLWSPEGFLRHPLVTVAADGEVLGVEQCAEPDRLAGVLIDAGIRQAVGHDEGVFIIPTRSPGKAILRTSLMTDQGLISLPVPPSLTKS